MSKRLGPMEETLRLAVQAYLARHKRGAATKLGKQIQRSSAWVGMLANGERRASLDDAIGIAKALQLDLLHVPGNHDTNVLAVAPKDKRERTVLRLFLQLQTEKSRNAVVTILRTLVDSHAEVAMRAEQQPKSARATARESAA